MMERVFFYVDRSVLLLAEGRDAERYLQARLTREVKALPVDGAGLAAALSAQGRTEGLFTILRTGSESFLLLSEGGDKDEVLTALTRFKVADRFTIAEADQVGLLHVVASADDDLSFADLSKCLSEFEVARLSDSVWQIGRRRSMAVGFDLIAPIERIAAVEAELVEKGYSRLSPEAQRHARLEAGIASFPEEVSPQRLFLESGLTAALSRNKGCYTGQEVIEKAVARGKVPRSLAHFQGHAAGIPEINTPLSLEGGGQIGKVLSFSITEDGSEIVGFASIKSDVPRGESFQGYLAGAVVTVTPVSLDYSEC